MEKGGRRMRDERHNFVVEKLKEMLIEMKESYENRELIRQDIIRQYRELEQLVKYLPEDFAGKDWMEQNLVKQEALLDEMEEVSKSNRKYIEQCEKSSASITYAIDLHAQDVLSDEELQDTIRMEAEIIEAHNPVFFGVD